MVSLGKCNAPVAVKLAPMSVMFEEKSHICYSDFLLGYFLDSGNGYENV